MTTRSGHRIVRQPHDSYLDLSSIRCAVLDSTSFEFISDLNSIVFY